MKNDLPKSPTGINGLDEITGGGLPKGRPTLVCGGAGCGKTLLAAEFIVKGIQRFEEPGAFITFEETAEELIQNVASLGYDMGELMESKRLYIKEIALDLQDVVEIGKYDLEGLFAHVAYALDAVDAKRLVVDGIEALFSAFTMERTLRAEIKRLFRWLKEKGVTAVVTGEAGDGTRKITRHGIEEYLSDCVILLDQRIQDQVATRRLHIVKYRGARHGTNEYPFLVTGNGISVLPITSLALDHEALSDRMSTGNDSLDAMFDGKGYYKGSSILVSGTAGTGKSSFAALFAKSVCESGNRCIYFSFEESPSQIVRNMRSIGVDLTPFQDKESLRFHSLRPTIFGLEMHLLDLHRTIEAFGPDAVILDPISNLTAIGTPSDIKLMLVRILDHLKKRHITAFCTNLSVGGTGPEATDIGVSSIMDTWILLESVRAKNRRERQMSIVKSRGMAHSDQVHRFTITDHGIVIENR